MHSVETRHSSDPIRILVVDDHPALREGLEGLLREEDGLVVLGAIAGSEDLAEAVRDGRPDVVILDYALHGTDGLSLCFRIKQLPAAPGVVMYSAYADPVFAVPATLAQADAIVSKTAPVDELLDAVRAVARGERRVPALRPEAMSAASSRVAPEDLPIVGMLFSGVTVADIAKTLRTAPEDVRARAARVIGELQRGPAAEPALR